MEKKISSTKTEDYILSSICLWKTAFFFFVCVTFSLNFCQVHISSGRRTDITSGPANSVTVVAIFLSFLGSTLKKPYNPRIKVSRTSGKENNVCDLQVYMQTQTTKL